MKCPFCQHDETQVLDSRVVEETNSIRRRRRCLSCNKRFNTFETAEIRMPQILKNTGVRTSFDEQKLRTSLERALHKRPVKVEVIDVAVNAIQKKLRLLGEREVPTTLIGEMAMAELAKIDDVAYVRFASVYRSFNDVSEFMKIIATISETDDIQDKKSH